ncbi:MAG: hypothetical protein GXY44_04475 [Phycisphaerales bacterium]|nr:hypothetical protein [Phycisphaerales bacterium]
MSILRQLVIITALGLLACMTIGVASGGERPINLVDFAYVVEFTGNSPQTYGTHRLDRGDEGWPAWRGPDGRFMIGIEWDEPRDLSEVNIEFRHAIADRDQISVQYWRSHSSTEGIQATAKALDGFHGEWVTARTDWYAGDRDVTFEFLPENTREQAKMQPFSLRTDRLRFILGTRDLPAVRYLRAYGPCPAVAADLEIRLDPNSPLNLPLEAEAVNGCLLDTQGRTSDKPVSFNTGAMSLRVRYAEGDTLTATRTIVTLREVHNPSSGFSFVPAEVVERGIVRIPSLGVVVMHHGSMKDLQTDYLPGTGLYDRIATEPARNWSCTRGEGPILDAGRSPNRPLLVPLGLPLARQEIAVGHDGRILLDRSSLQVRAADSDRWDRPQARWGLRLQVGLRIGDRVSIPEYATELLDGYLPIISTRWQDQGLACVQTAVATYLDGEPEDHRGDETVVLLSRLIVHNPTDEPVGAVISWHTEPAEALVLNHGLVMARGVFRDGRLESYPELGYRFHIKHDPDQRVEVVDDPVAGSLLLWKFALEAYQHATIELAVPFVPPADDHQRERLAALNFDDTVLLETKRWRQIVDKAARFETPDRLLNDFYKAQLVHTLITADRDPYEGTWQLPAATLSEKVGIRRAYSPIRALEIRGLHDMAASFLAAFIRGQSSLDMVGRFTDRLGVFHGLPSEHANYQGYFDNQDHGCALWMLNEHYLYTRDRTWLSSQAKALVKACDFITRQRLAKGVHGTAAKDKHWGMGLLPPGRIDGHTDWAWWYAVNAWAWRGIRATADNLATIGHPETERIAANARDFGQVLRASCRESMIRAPVVRLEDGTYIPLQPERSRTRGREANGFGPTALGSLALLECGVYPYHSPEAEWILRYLQENKWSSLCDGVSAQSNYASLVPVYLHRGQYKHALRAFYDALTTGLYEETRMLAGRVRHPGQGEGPWYALTEEAELVYALRCLLVLEHNDELWLLSGVPDAWLEPGQRIEIEGAATWFGPMDVHVQALAEPTRVVIDLNAPRRERPTRIMLHLHRPLSSVLLNGQPLTTFDASQGTIELPGDVGRVNLVAYQPAPLPRTGLPR